VLLSRGRGRHPTLELPEALQLGSPTRRKIVARTKSVRAAEFAFAWAGHMPTTKKNKNRNLQHILISKAAAGLYAAWNSGEPELSQ